MAHRFRGSVESSKTTCEVPGGHRVIALATKLTVASAARRHARLAAFVRLRDPSCDAVTMRAGKKRSSCPPVHRTFGGLSSMHHYGGHSKRLLHTAMESPGRRSPRGLKSSSTDGGGENHHRCGFGNSLSTACQADPAMTHRLASDRSLVSASEAMVALLASVGMLEIERMDEGW